MQSKLFVIEPVAEVIAKREAAASKDSKKRRRRYYLHRVCKRFARLVVASKTFYMLPGELEKLSTKQKTYMEELQVNYGYSIQTEIQ